jgi:FkbM family methyltransferase
MSWLGFFLRDIAARLPGGRRLNAELAQSRRQRDLLQQRLDRSERLRDVLRRRLETRRLRALAARPDEAVLEHVLPLRHAAMLASNHDGRAARESAFAARSAAYRDAVAGTGATGAENPSPESACVIVAGLSWWIPKGANERDGISGRLEGKGRLPLREILDTRELAVGRVMIDIGANVGTTSIPRALLGDFNCVYAAEPDPGNYACLVRNIVTNRVRGLVLPDRVAIGDANGEMTLRMLRSGTHHLVTRASDVEESERQTVPCLTLDTWVERIGIDLSEVGFIKSDTQGWDARVLAGAPGVLAHKHIAWQIEFSPAMLQRAGVSTAEAYESMQAHFTHFIDLRGDSGARVRPTSGLREALAYVGAGRRRYTNLLLYTSA